MCLARRHVRRASFGVQRESIGVLALEVDARANKLQIRRAVEELLKVKVAEVRVANCHGKVRRQGRFAGRRADWKKAYVRLAAGEKMVDFFEGA